MVLRNYVEIGFKVLKWFFILVGKSYHEEDGRRKIELGLLDYVTNKIIHFCIGVWWRYKLKYN